MLLGADALKKLSSSRVAVFGVGGVGGYVVEALARCGVGSIDLIDNDRVVLSNLNRQIIATMDTIGRKVTVNMKNGKVAASGKKTSAGKNKKKTGTKKKKTGKKKK